MARICWADEVRCPRHRRVSEQSAGGQPQGPGGVRSGWESGRIPNDAIAAGKGEPARLRRRHKVPGGHAGPAIHRKVVSIFQAKSHGPIDVGRATKSFGRNADDEELATIYE